MLLQQSERTLFQHHAVFQSLISLLLVLDKAFEHEVSEDGHTGAAHHTVGLATGEVPYRQLALFTEDAHERVGEVALHVRTHKCHERISSAVGIPQREGAVGGVAGTMYASVGTTIVAIGIAEHRRSDHEVVHRGVEHLFLVLVGGLHGNACELLVPCLVGSGHSGIEVPSRQLSLHVCLCTHNIDRRKGHLNEQRLAVGLCGYDGAGESCVARHDGHGL